MIERIKTGFQIIGAIGLISASLPTMAQETPTQNSQKKQSGKMENVDKPGVKVDWGTYHGWKKTIRLSNGVAELIFVPQIGRIMRYGYLNEPNMLWNNDALVGQVIDPKNPPKEWMNFGGDKLWPAPQAKWGWPPDPIMEAGQQTAALKEGKTLVVTGMVSPKHHVQFTREITLSPQGTEVTLVNILKNVGKTDETWSCWEIAQTDDPDRVKIPVSSSGKHPMGYYTFPDSAPDAGLVKVEGDILTLERSKIKSSKIGSDAPMGTLVAERGKTRFTLLMHVESGKPYPDENCPLEIYTSPDPMDYVELELLSPLVKLKPGASIKFTTHWILNHFETTEK